MKKYLLAAVAVSLFTAPAIAADMPVPQAPYRAAMPAAFDWTGFYIGGQAGWQGSRIRLNDPALPASLVYTPHHDSFAGGGFIGAQRQVGQFVFGVEGAYIAATGHESFGATGVNIFTAGGTSEAQARLKDIWSAGGRLGWAAGNWMPYLTGGYASGRFDMAAVDTPAPVASMQARSTNGGFYVGGGVDWALVNGWILGVEYRHYDFSSKTVTDTVSGATPVRFDPRSDTVMARLSYKWDWGKSPVVARY